MYHLVPSQFFSCFQSSFCLTLWTCSVIVWRMWFQRALSTLILYRRFFSFFSWFQSSFCLTHQWSCFVVGRLPELHSGRQDAFWAIYACILHGSCYACGNMHACGDMLAISDLLQWFYRAFLLMISVKWLLVSSILYLLVRSFFSWFPVKLLPDSMILFCYCLAARVWFAAPGSRPNGDLFEAPGSRSNVNQAFACGLNDLVMLLVGCPSW